MSIIDSLIYDRTLLEANYIRSLATKGWANMTETERYEFLYGYIELRDADGKLLFDSSGEAVYCLGVSPKGGYNYIDLNRVGEAAEYLAQQFVDLISEILAYRVNLKVDTDPLNELPYEMEDVTVSPKTNWTVNDIPTSAQRATYLNNISTLRGIITLPEETPGVPSNMENFDYSQANDIEKILTIIHTEILLLEAGKKTIIDNTYSQFFMAGELISGEFGG